MRFTTAALAAVTLCLGFSGCKQAAPPTGVAAGTVAPPNAAYAYRVVIPPTQSSPSISEIDFNDKALSAPGPVAVLVKTSDDVATLSARLLGREQGLPKLATGQFGGTQQLPQIPFFLKGRDYAVDFVATTADGRTAQAQVVVHLNR